MTATLWMMVPEAECAERFAPMKDGDAILNSREWVVKCSHVRDGACTACLMPLMAKVSEHIEGLERERDEAMRAKKEAQR
jgi:hypothetical protein